MGLTLSGKTVGVLLTVRGYPGVIYTKTLRGEIQLKKQEKGWEKQGHNTLGRKERAG